MDSPVHRPPQEAHPRALGAAEVASFLSSLAARGVSASTQNRALSAVLFLYRVVLGQRLEWMNDMVRAQRPVRLPVVLSRSEVGLLLAKLRGAEWLAASLMYGAGLRLLETVELRVKDLSFERGELTVRAAHEAVAARGLTWFAADGGRCDHEPPRLKPDR